MNSLTEIKNAYAIEQGYEDWESFINYYGGRHPEWFDKHWTEICILAQKAALEKAAENAMVNFCHKEIKKEITDDYGQTYWVHEESITNPENLVR